jgi:hypothetical protein
MWLYTVYGEFNTLTSVTVLPSSDSLCHNTDFFMKFLVAFSFLHILKLCLKDMCPSLIYMELIKQVKLDITWFDRINYFCTESIAMYLCEEVLLYYVLE